MIRPIACSADGTWTERPKREWDVAAGVALVIAGAAICTAGMLGAPWLVRLIAPGFADDPEKLELTIALTIVVGIVLGIAAIAKLAGQQA